MKTETKQEIIKNIKQEMNTVAFNDNLGYSLKVSFPHTGKIKINLTTMEEKREWFYRTKQEAIQYIESL